MRFTAKVKDGKVVWHDTSNLKRYLNQIEGYVYIDIKPAKTRNSAQNNYYWQMLKELGNQVGYHSDEMHDICKVKFKIKYTK